MKESDLENHIAEVKEFQQRLRNNQELPQGNRGLKRSAEDEIVRKEYFDSRLTNTNQTTFH